jgi:hypothetical protein
MDEKLFKDIMKKAFNKVMSEMNAIGVFYKGKDGAFGFNFNTMEMLHNMDAGSYLLLAQKLDEETQAEIEAEIKKKNGGGL